MPEQKYDIIAQNHGSITLLVAPTPDGLAWLKENAAAEPYQWQDAITLLCDYRMAGAILEGAAQDGLAVRT